MSNHPIIGLNMSMDLIDKYEKYGLLVPVSYVDAVARASGVPICLPPSDDFTIIKRMLQLVDGVVLIGGDDYWPDHFGGHPQPDDELMPERRDRFDLEFAKLALNESTLPVLGICGGHQLIGIAQGGALIQDIRTEWNSPADCPSIPHSRKERNDEKGPTFRHPLRLESGSLVERAAKVSANHMLMTNSSHHQAVHPQRTGRYLRASAWTPDGVVEAIEPSLDSPWALSGRFILGVQWHPEQMQDEEPQRNIFRAFVESARKK
ncbi:MAG TPA: gamma-glutamyl-gamma-aminobutyrate hydrolase family protein [Syntrophales bacterium]|nr:gamma-glutamyl-gamma-aminobutyrate hydrolase family protein [Syntrophales bacterium]